MSEFTLGTGVTGGSVSVDEDVSGAVGADFVEVGPTEADTVSESSSDRSDSEEEEEEEEDVKEETGESIEIVSGL